MGREIRSVRSIPQYGALLVGVTDIGDIEVFPTYPASIIREAMYVNMWYVWYVRAFPSTIVRTVPYHTITLTLSHG